jgi:catechol 2,3-dioxygenase-like lactoylglutathione lyase family enzyme
MARGLDHIVHAVRDLDAAADLYRRLGFTVGSRNRHPPEWGTENHIVQLPGVYVELLGLGDTARTAPHGAQHFSFGAFNRDFLARGEGLSMLALQGQGAPDAEAFGAAGIGDFAPFEMAREARRPDGTTVRLAFTLTFARDPKAPYFGAFAIRHHFPEHFWNPAAQVHANTAAAVTGVVLVAENPSDHHIFLSALTGECDLLATSAGLTIKTPRGDIQVMTPAAFGDHFGTEPPSVANGARLAALRFAVRDLDQAARLLQGGGLSVAERMGQLIVGPQTALGATLAFERI